MLTLQPSAPSGYLGDGGVPLSFPWLIVPSSQERKRFEYLGKHHDRCVWLHCPVDAVRSCPTTNTICNQSYCLNHPGYCISGLFITVAVRWSRTSNDQMGAISRTPGNIFDPYNVCDNLNVVCMDCSPSQRAARTTMQFDGSTFELVQRGPTFRQLQGHVDIDRLTGT